MLTLATTNDSFWITIVACAISFVAGMWLKNRIMSWITKG